MEKKSFFERLTGSTSVEHKIPVEDTHINTLEAMQDEEGQLTVDMWQTPTEIVIQAIVGGVKSEDLDVNISHEMVTIKGKREKEGTGFPE